MPRRILHVLNYGWPAIDGYTVRSMGLVTAQQRHLGFDVAVAVSPFVPLTKASDPDFSTAEWGPDTQIQAVTYNADGPHRVGRFERPALGLAPTSTAVFCGELASIVERLQPDLIHAHHPHYIGSTALDVARERGIPFVYEIRCFNGDYDLDARNPYSLLRGRYQNQLEIQVCRAASAVVTISTGLARRIIASGVPEDRVFVVRNSINTDLFASAAAGQRDDTTLRIGYATTFEAIENLDTFVRSLLLVRGALRQQGRTLVATIAGTGRDWERINALVAELGLGDTVQLPGFVPYGQMPAFYRSLDLFVVPRGHAAVAADTTPLKPLEALAAGLPLLVSNLPAMRELLGGRDDVRFFTPSEAELSQALLAFANEPWAGHGRDLENRSWRREIRRYPFIYTVAEHNGSPKSDTSLPAQAQRTAKHIAALPRRQAKRVLRAVVDRGLFRLQPLETHVVVCGFPRTGSTLLQLMIECCIDDVRTFPTEIDALWAAPDAVRNQRYMLTKQPSDIHQLQAVRDFYAQHHGTAHFVLTVRDPRAVLISRHNAYPSSRGYYVSCERWQAVYDCVTHYQHNPDVSVVRYEDLVAQPALVEQQLAQAVGWPVAHPFERFYEIAQQRGLQRDSMTEGALGGLRPLDTQNIAKWRRPEHRERLHAVLDAIPALPEYLIAMGYEQDETWLETLELIAQ